MKKLLLCMGIIMLVNTANAVSIGAGPSTLKFEKMIRGGYSEKMITVSTSGDENLSCHIEVTGPIKDWMTIQPAMSFTLPSNSHFDLKVIIQPPSDTGNGVYKGLIRIRADPTAKITTGTGVVFGAGVTVDVTVNITGIESSAYKVTKSNVDDTEIGHPVELNIDIYNAGNVKNSPNIRVDFFDENGTTLLKSFYYNETEIWPSRRETISIRTSVDDIGVGKHIASINSYMAIKNETTNRIQEGWTQHSALSFEVFESGTLLGNGTMMNFKLDKTTARVDDTVRITALFKNMGALPATATLEGEILDGLKFVDKFESKELEINAGETKNLIAYYTPKREGTFTAKGAVRYGKKTTPPREAALTVGGGANYLLYGVIVSILALGAYVYLKMRKTQ